MNIISNRFPISVFTLLTQLILLISFVGCQNSKTSNKELIKIPKSERNSIGANGRSWLINNRKYEKLADDYLALLI